MNRDRFWEIIEHSRSQWDVENRDGNMNRQCEVLAKLLKKLDRKELVSYATHYHQLRVNAYRWDLWAAAYILGGGCSDDGFMDFRNWLISLGRDVYEAALEDSETLTTNPRVHETEDFFFEQFSYVAHRVYEENFEEPLPRLNIPSPEDPLGERFSENEKDLEKRLPKLFKAYWK